MNYKPTNNRTMKKIVILIILLLAIPTSFSLTYAQGVGIGTKDKTVVIDDDDDPKNQRRRTPIDYENFELTKENLPWAKEQVQKEKEQVEKDFKNGKITEAQYETRMGKIAEAQRRIAEFEASPANIDQLAEEEDEEVVIDPSKTELVNQKDAQDKRREAREERERKEREAKRKANDVKRYEMALENITREIVKLEADKKSGAITEKEYNEKMARLREAEQRVAGQLENAKNANPNKTANDQNKDPKSRGSNETKPPKASKDNDLQNTVSDGEKRIADAKDRVKKEKAQMEKDLKAGTITTEQYNDKKLKIERIEKAIKDLEKKVQEGKNL